MHIFKKISKLISVHNWVFPFDRLIQMHSNEISIKHLRNEVLNNQITFMYAKEKIERRGKERK